MAPFSYARQAILWNHLMAPFYGMCVLGLTTADLNGNQTMTFKHHECEVIVLCPDSERQQHEVNQPKFTTSTLSPHYNPPTVELNS